jgi:protoporphyrinogen oxidase
MLVAKFGRGIAERFLIPYNEKLYACALGALDVDAMGRFFPFADLEEIVANFRRPDNGSYNATFTYPRGGAIEYVKALASEIPAEQICLGEGLAAVDLERKVARTSQGREIAFEYLISSAPLPALLEMTGLPWAREDFSANQVAVFNLGFDRKGWEGVHWVYFPSPSQVFYRVGFYDNILGGPRMSLYVEVGQRAGEAVDMEALRARVLDDLRGCGVIDGHQLVSHHQIILNPAYVHITRRSLASVARLRGLLQARGVYPVGRYGGWTYCSIEDNIVEARALAGTFNELHHRDQGE